MTNEPVDPVTVAKLLDEYRAARAEWDRVYAVSEEIKAAYEKTLEQLRERAGAVEAGWKAIMKLGYAGFTVPIIHSISTYWGSPRFTLPEVVSPNCSDRQTDDVK